MAEPQTAPQALDGVRVLELAGAEGEYCGKLLADFGAEVIKVEPPGGSPSRGEPPFKDDRPGPDRSLPFLYFNANKKSITADLDTEAGRERVRRLARNADVVVESAAPGTLAAMGWGTRICGRPTRGWSTPLSRLSARPGPTAGTAGPSWWPSPWAGSCT